MHISVAFWNTTSHFEHLLVDRVPRFRAHVVLHGGGGGSEWGSYNQRVDFGFGLAFYTNRISAI